MLIAIVYASNCEAPGEGYWDANACRAARNDVGWRKGKGRGVGRAIGLVERLVNSYLFSQYFFPIFFLLLLDLLLSLYVQKRKSYWF